MLPGFRFILASIVLSVSLVIFGLGAAGLLRSTHEKFATIQIRRADPAIIAAQPALAMLRVEAPEPDSNLPSPARRDAPIEVPQVTPAHIETAFDSALTSIDVTGPRTSAPTPDLAVDIPLPAAASLPAPDLAVLAPPALVLTPPPGLSLIAFPTTPPPQLSAPPETVPAAIAPEPAQTPILLDTPAIQAAAPEAQPGVAPIVIAALAPPPTPSMETPIAAPIAIPMPESSLDVPDTTGTLVGLIAARDVKIPRQRPMPALLETPTIQDAAPEAQPGSESIVIAALASPPTPSVETPIAAPVAIQIPEPSLDVSDITGTLVGLIAARDVKLPRQRPNPVAESKSDRKADKKSDKKAKAARSSNQAKSRPERVTERPPAPAPQTYRAQAFVFD